MRNLKRALSLTLASVMLLGMMVVGSSAASYPDVEDTHNVEAIEVLKTIKVMVGDDNGNFGPDDQVNRAQMAVVMALLLDLDYDYYKGTNPFWDVPSWAEPYVAACYANGIVSGYNATTYGSGDPVTAVQAASMMMRALGYFKYQSDYKDGFELATVRQASKLGLFADVNAASNNTALTRNQVAQLALNTLETAVVDAKDNTLSINTGANAGNISITGGQVDYVVRTSTDQKISRAINKVEQGNTETDGKTGWTVELGEQLFQGDLKKDADTDDFERPATRWTYKFSEIGTYADTPDYTYTTSISGDTPADKVKNMGLKGYKWDGVYYENGVKNDTTCAASDAAARLGKLAADVAADGVLIEVYMDDDNTDTIERVTVIYTQMMQVNAVSSSEVTLKKLDDDKRAAEISGDGQISVGTHPGFMTVKTVKEDDAGYNVLKNLKTDDYVLIVPVVDAGQYKVASAVVPETASGVLETINTKSTDGKVKSIKVAGETYKMSNTWTAADDELRRDTKLTSKQDCQVYLDTYGNAIYVKDVKAANSAIIVDYIYSAVENGKIVKYAEGWDSNGNEISLNLGTSPANVPNPEADIQGMVFEYKASNVNDADYELIPAKLTWADADTNIVYGYSNNGSNAAGQTVNYTEYNKLIGHDSTAGADATEKTLPFDSAVKFIYISSEGNAVGTDVTGITVKTGVSEVTASAKLTYILNSDRTKIIAVVVPNDDDAGNTASLLYLEAITSHSNNSNGKRVAYGTIWVDGEKTTGVELNKDYGSGDVDKFYTYSESNGVYTLTPYNKTTKVTSVQTGKVLTRAELVTGKQSYWFDGDPTGGELILNGNGAQVFDLYGDDGKFYDTVKGMQDAIKNGDVSEKTNSAIENFKVSFVYNGDRTDSGYRSVKYVFITKSNDGVNPGGGAAVPTENKMVNGANPGEYVYKIGVSQNASPSPAEVAAALANFLKMTFDASNGDTAKYDSANQRYEVKINGSTLYVTINNSANGDVADAGNPDDIQSSLNGGNDTTMVGAGNTKPDVDKPITVPADTTLTLTKGATVTKPVTVTGTLATADNITTTGADGKIVVKSTGTLKLNNSGAVTLPTVIEAEQGATLVIGASAVVTAPANMFYAANGTVIAQGASVPAGTYTWYAEGGWDARSREATPSPAGWYAEGSSDPGPDPGPSEGTKAKWTSSQITEASTTYKTDKVKVTIGGKAYDVADTNNTVALQATAWAAAWNADDSRTADAKKWEAVAEDGAITLTCSDKTVTTDTTDLTDGTLAAGDGTNTASTVSFTAAGAASETAGDNNLVTVTVNGKAYDVAKDGNATIATQLAAWVAKFNADATYKNDWTASVGTNNDTVVVEAETVGVKTSQPAGLTGGTFVDGTAATPAT